MSTDKIVAIGKNDQAALKELAKVAEKTDRYEDMCGFLKQLVALKKGDLDAEERNILSVAYKNVVGTKRGSWRTLNSTITETPTDNAQLDKFKDYLNLIQAELKGRCMEILTLLDDHLIGASKGGEDQEVHTFYLKMKGDYYRYLAEIFKNSEENFAEEAEKAYKAATEVAKESLDVTNPTRLGLALNFSVCYYEILDNKTEACSLAKKAFDDAISKLDMLNDSNYKDSTLIMQLLRDNLTLWTSESNAKEDIED